MLGMVDQPNRNALSIGFGGLSARRMVVAILASWTVFGSVSNFAELGFAQNRQPPARQTPNAGQPGKPSPQPSKPGFQAPGTPKPAAPVRKMSEEEKRKERVRALFADAANAQNNGAYPLALEQWQRLIKEFPGDPLASSARYYLGLCYQEQSPPDYANAVGSFRKSLEDKDLKEQEEALVNLGWCLVQLGSDPQKESKATLAEASKVFASFLEKYPDSPSVDRAIFYAGEAESRLGNTEKAVGFYNQLAQNKKLTKSPLVPEALFALGFSYEELKQPKLASENYEALLAGHSKHPLVRDANVRLGEIALQLDKPDQAAARYEQVIGTTDFKKAPLADYIYSRYAFALAKSGQYAKSSEAYKQLATLFPNSKYAQNASLSMAQALMRDKKYAQAREAFVQVLASKDSKAIEAAHWLCQIAVLQNQKEQVVPIAREALEWATRIPAKDLTPATRSQLALLKLDLADGLFATAEGKAEARKLFEQIAVEYADEPVSPRATYNAAFAAMQMGDLPEALRWAEAFETRFAGSELIPDVGYVRAESLLQRGEHPAASVAFEKLVQSAKDHPSRTNWELRGITAQYLAGQPEKALVRIDAIVNQSKDPAVQAEARFLQGACLLKLSKPDESIAALDQSLKLSSTWGQADEVLLVLAQAHEAKQDKVKAKEVLERLLKEFPKSRFKTQAEFRLGQLSAQAGKTQESIDWYQRVIVQNTDTSLRDFAKFDTAYLLIQQNQYAQAQELVLQVIDSTKNSGLAQEAIVANAICLRQTGKLQDSIGALTKLIEQNPTKGAMVKALYELGVGLVSDSQFERAVAIFDRIEQEFPAYALMDRVLFERAWAQKELGQLEQANRSFRAIAEKYPESPVAAESYFHVGQADFDNASFETAVKAYTVAASKSSSKELQEKSLYKIGLSLYQQKQYEESAKRFSKQLAEFPKGELSLDARLMIAECAYKLQQYASAMIHYDSARKALENAQDRVGIQEQVQSLIYLHGAQTASELKKWADVEAWVTKMATVVPDSNLLPIARYEQAVALQNLKRNEEALKLFESIAEEQRNELGARSRFMEGELWFAQQDYAKAVQVFQKVMYGFGGTQAPQEIKNWQARSAYEAGRCSEVLIGDLTGERRRKAIDAAKKFYEFLLSNHSDHELAKQSQDRIDELSKGQ
jgi:cellulose synthase operon protein C